MFIIYYLYWQTEPEGHFVPYIYKKSNELSGFVRGTLLPAQTSGELYVAGYGLRTAKNGV